MLAHDWLVGRRGGEAVLDRIARLVLARQDRARTPVLTMFDACKPIGDSVDRLPRLVPELTSIPGANALRRWMLPFYPFAVERLSDRLAEEHARDPIRLVLSTSSAAIKGLRMPPGVAHVCYCHTPARYLWSQQEEYARASPLMRLGFEMFGADLRSWDRDTSSVTLFLANSTHTAREIERCYGRQARVVHPPVRTGFFTPSDARRTPRWLFAGAIEPYKRADLALAAAAIAGVPLNIVGEGSQRDRLLRSPAAAVATFEAGLSDEQFRERMRTARLLVFPQIEDFGITAVEALACGTPVVARRAGGALDFIREGQTGAFFDQPTPESLAAAAARCPDPRDLRVATACREAAIAFSEDAFDRSMESVLHEFA